tara:strand:+ start:185 stop:466 length:282 start_codon:yes stop_codon:yes gene_type:complete
MIKVKQLRSSSSGRDIANQFIITDKDRTIFQSYDSIIAIKWNDGDVFLDKTYWDYSRTTGKYRNQFLGEDIKTTRKKIKSKEYRLVDLNNTYN